MSSDVGLSDAETVKGEGGENDRNVPGPSHAIIISQGPVFQISATGRINVERNGSRSLAPVRDTRRDRLTIESKTYRLLPPKHFTIYNKRPI